MCIIHYVPAGVEINEDGLYNGAISNDDGHGWAVASKNGLFVGKSLNYIEAIDQYMEVRAREGLGSLGLFHSRFGTHGTMNEYNVHPFYVGTEGTTVMAHNGVMPVEFHPGKDDKRSDTRVFVDSIGDFVNTSRGVPSRRGGQALGKIIGPGNKLVFLSVKDGPKARIVNAHSGLWENGTWYSNRAFEKPQWRSRYAQSWKSSPVDGLEKDPVTGVWRKKDSATRLLSVSDSGVTVFGHPIRDDLTWWEREELKNQLAQEGLCPNCGSSEVSVTTNLCEDCLYCVDCGVGLDDCICHYGETSSVRIESEVKAALEEYEDVGYISAWAWGYLSLAAQKYITEYFPDAAPNEAWSGGEAAPLDIYDVVGMEVEILNNDTTGHIFETGARGVIVGRYQDYYRIEVKNVGKFTSVIQSIDDSEFLLIEPDEEDEPLISVQQVLDREAIALPAGESSGA